eukprot:5366250-Alexandrium_andersonii.AAC.1
MFSFSTRSNPGTSGPLPSNFARRALTLLMEGSEGAAEELAVAASLFTVPSCARSRESKWST